MRSDARHRGLLLATLLVLALVWREAMPMVAVAAPVEAGATETLLICTGTGMQAIAVPADGGEKQPARMVGCPDCLLAAPAVLPPPAPQAVGFSAYARPFVWSLACDPSAVSARGPPRPPSRAPPVLV